MLSKISPITDSYRFLFISLILVSLIISIKLNSILIAILFTSWLVFVPNQSKKNYLKANQKKITPFLAFILLFILSLLYSDDLSNGIKDIESKLSIILLPIAILGQKPLSQLEVNKIFSVFSYSTLFACLVSFIISLISFQRILINQELSALIGIHASYLSMYAAISAFYFLKKIIKKENILFSSISFSILIISILLLSARMVILASIISMVVWFIFFQTNLRKLLLICISIILLGIVGYSVKPIKHRFEEAFIGEQVKFGNNADPNAEVKNYGGKAIRVAIWKCSIGIIKDNWMIGVGAGDVHEHLQKSYKEKEFELAWRFNNYNAHNLFIETIIAVGILGVLVLLILFGKLFTLAYQKKDLLIFAFTTLFFLFSIMESSLNVQRGLVYFILITSVFFSSSIKKV